MSDLKSYLIENLDNTGTLEKIKDDLKNNLFNTLREENSIKPPTGFDNSTSETAAELVRDFLETFCLQYSLSVFLPESKLPERPYQRESLEKKLSIKGIDDLPLISTVLSNFKKNEDTGESLDSSGN